MAYLKGINISGVSASVCLFSLQHIQPKTEAIHFDALAPPKKDDLNYYEGNKNVTFKSLCTNIRFFVTFVDFFLVLAEHSSTAEISFFWCIDAKKSLLRKNSLLFIH